MKKINKYTQYALLAAVGINILISIIEPGYLIFLLFIGIPIGITQYLGSLIDVVIKGRQSKYLIHLILSTIVLLLIALSTDVGFRFHISSGLENKLESIGYVSCPLLAIYFWIVTFQKDEIIMQQHNVFDL